VLGIPEGTARSRLRRAREALEERLRVLDKELPSTIHDLDGWAESLRGLKGAVLRER
jgi:hypothetical protein